MTNSAPELAAPILAVSDGFEELVLQDGPGGLRTKRFHGRLLVEERDLSRRGLEVVRIYLSRKGKFVVHHRESDWTDLYTSVGAVTDWKNWCELFGLVGDSWGDYTLSVVDSVEDIRDLVSPTLYRRAVAAVERPRTADYLDI